MIVRDRNLNEIFTHLAVSMLDMFLLDNLKVCMVRLVMCDCNMACKCMLVCQSKWLGMLYPNHFDLNTNMYYMQFDRMERTLHLVHIFCSYTFLLIKTMF